MIRKKLVHQPYFNKLYITSGMQINKDSTTHPSSTYTPPNKPYKQVMQRRTNPPPPRSSSAAAAAGPCNKPISSPSERSIKPFKELLEVFPPESPSSLRPLCPSSSYLNGFRGKNGTRVCCGGEGRRRKSGRGEVSVGMFRDSVSAHLINHLI